MKRRIGLLFMVLIMTFSATCTAFANAEAASGETSIQLTSDKFILYVDVLKPDSDIIPSDLRFNIFTEDGMWLANRCNPITQSGTIAVEFQVPVYEIGSKFRVVATTGAQYVKYYEKQYALNEEFIVDTYAYRDAENNVVISNSAHVVVCPFFTEWKVKAENFVNSQNIKSETPYMVWISKNNFKVSVFLNENGKWNCIKNFGCSIGAPSTPTITGQYKYIQYQKMWDYGTYYCGPIMRFYNGYAIHSTLLYKDGTDYDGRIGKMISHGCVRVRPENIKWLVDYVPLGTKIYVTNE